MNPVQAAPPPVPPVGDKVLPAISLTTARILLMSLLIAFVIFIVGMGIDSLLLYEQETRNLAIDVSDALGGLVAGVLFFHLLQYERERRTRLRQKLAVIADMNHHVRNALQVISYHAYSHADKKQWEVVHESVERIQWALDEVLPKV